MVVFEFKTTGEVFALSNLLDQSLVAPIRYGHRVGTRQGIVLQRHQGRFRDGTTDELEAIERENADQTFAVVVYDAIGLKC